MKWSISLLLALATAASAQGYLHRNESDSRVQLVRYVPDQPITLPIALGFEVAILLDSGERIQTIRLSDPNAYHVNVAPAADGVSLRQTRPLGYSSSMSVETGARRYEFVLISGPDVVGPYVVRFDYTTPSLNNGRATASSQDITRLTSYKLSGNKELRPQSIVDDGGRTYIQWASGQSVPAVFAIDRLGREEMVDGYMRDGVFTIDRVHDRLVFRVDKVAMTAKRQAARIKKP